MLGAAFFVAWVYGRKTIKAFEVSNVQCEDVGTPGLHRRCQPSIVHLHALNIVVQHNPAPLSINGLAIG